MKQEIMLHMVEAMPENVITKKIEEAASRHSRISDEESREHLTMYCMMFVMKQAIIRDGVKAVATNMENIDKLMPLVTFNKN